jgi:hypothetical protein
MIVFRAVERQSPNSVSLWINLSYVRSLTQKFPFVKHFFTYFYFGDDSFQRGGTTRA